MNTGIDTFGNYVINGAGNVSIGSQKVEAALDISSTTDGILIPRMTTAQKNAISTPSHSTLVYETNIKSFWFYENSIWNELGAGSGIWSKNGIDVYYENGNVSIGTQLFEANLHVVGADTLGQMLIAPIELSNGVDSEIFLAEDNDGSYGMGLKFDEAENELSIFGKTVSTIHGSHLTMTRNSGDIDITGNVGIGTDATSTSQLQIFTATANDEGFIVLSTRTGGQAGIKIVRSNVGNNNFLGIESLVQGGDGANAGVRG